MRACTQERTSPRRRIGVGISVIAVVALVGCENLTAGLDHGYPGPVSLSGTASDGSATLSWTDPEASGFTGVEISWNPDGGEIVQVDAGAEVFEASGLTTGERYEFALRAIYTDGGRSALETVELTVALTDAEAVAAALPAVEPGYRGGDTASALLHDLFLPTEGTYDTQISWTSSDATRVAADGSVSRPTLSQSDATVELTATVTRGSVSEAKSFTLAVLRSLFDASADISYAPAYAIHVSAADLDGDSDQDIAVADSSADVILTIMNADGAGGFAAASEIATGIAGAFWVSAADLDADGDEDLLSASLSDDTVGWYENDGSGAFGSRQVITTTAQSATQALVADFDGANGLDVLVVSTGDDTVEWFQNDGAADPSFTSAEIVDSTRNPNDVIVADVDDDGDPDIVTSSRVSDEVVWYANDGSGTFGAAQLIAGSLNGPSSVAVGDIDGDGHSDILIADGTVWDASPDTITWYKASADPTPTFSTPANAVISGDAPGVNSAILVDVESDGDLDVVVARYDSSVSYDEGGDAVIWYENDGAGTFGTAQTISSALPGPSVVSSADVDGDGDLDLIAASRREGFGNGIHWFENRQGE